jgi:hypothetical protein
MDGARSPLFSPAVGPQLSLLRALLGLRDMAEAAESMLRADEGGELQDEAADQIGGMKGKPA